MRAIAGGRQSETTALTRLLHALLAQEKAGCLRRRRALLCNDKKPLAVGRTPQASLNVSLEVRRRALLIRACKVEISEAGREV